MAEDAGPIPGDNHADNSNVQTSRLCVKNLPKYVNETRLREHFGARGEVTDVKVMKTRDGQSRQLAFIGFRTVEQAAAAQTYFDKTFIDTCRLVVEFARTFKDPELARPWSKHSQGSSANQKKLSKVVDGAAAEAEAKAAKKKGKGAGVGEEVADPKLAEFLALMAPRSKARLWSNDELMDSGAVDPKTLQKMQQEAARAQRLAQAGGDGDEDDQEGSSDDDEYQDLEAKAREEGRGVGAAGRLDGSEDGSDGEEQADEEAEEGEEGAAAPALRGKEEVVVSSAVSDLDYLRSRMKKWDDNDDDDMEQVKEDEDAGAGGMEVDEDADADADEDMVGGSAAERGDQSGVGTSKSADKGDKQQKGRKAGAKGERSREGTPQPGSEDGEGKEQQDGGPLVVVAGSEDNISDTGRLFVRNLSYTATEAELAEAFGVYGDLSEVHLVLDRESKKSKGIAYIQFTVPEDAVKAHASLDGQIFQGRLLHILPAKRPPVITKVEVEEAAAGGEGAEDKGSARFKAQREEQRKADAGNRSVWNTLFMRSDTVAEAIAAHYGVSKSELLDRSASDLPVRMALGEAHVIAQTKEALAEAGVDVTKLEAAAAASGKASATKSVARSPTALLVKNLPYATEESELLSLFSRCGTVARLVLPPARTLALVEYLEPSDARAAFKALAYKKFQHVPLYLEWAPKDVFSTPMPAKPAAAAAPAAAKPPTAKQQAAAAAAAPSAAAVARDVEAGEDDSAVVAGSIYVKNLSFNTTDASLRKHFDKVVSSVGGTLNSARVMRRQGPDGRPLSMGFGFVECDSDDVAKMVIKQLQGSSLDGHKLSLQLSKRKAPTAAAAGGAKSSAAQAAADKSGKASDGVSTKLVVRNVAFEATRKDIAGLFGPFGHLKSCRLPKKFDGSHRGFAFVEFVTKQEAKNAIEGVGGTHLYGRRLVVEYAKEEGGLDELRAKTASKYRDEDGPDDNAPAAKRLKKGL